MRDHKRPIVTYTEVLNSLSDEEWSQLKLPPVATVRHVCNVQLLDLENPLFFQAHSGRVEVELSTEQDVLDMAIDTQSIPNLGARASLVPDVGQCLSSAHKDEAIAAGDIVACVEDVSPAQLSEAPVNATPNVMPVLVVI